MTEIRTTKLQIRHGNISDLPVLDISELGYAIDQHRLFIGNPELILGFGNGSNVDFALPAISNTPLAYDGFETVKFYVDSNERNDVTISIGKITFSTAPANGAVVSMKFNSEFELMNKASRPGTLILAADNPVVPQASGFSFNSFMYDAAFIDYTLKLANGEGFSIGSLKIIINNVAGTFNIDQQFITLTSAVDVEFDGAFDINDNFMLTYKNAMTEPAEFKYTFKLWKM